VTVDLDSLLGHQHAVGGEAGGAGPLGPEACRRLACDSAVTRVLVTRHQRGHHGHHGDPGDHDDPNGHHGHNPGGPSGDHQHQPHTAAGAEVGPLAGAQSQAEGLAGLLRAAMHRLPPALGGFPSQPLNVGRASRVVIPAQRSALAVRDGGWVFPDCTRPLAWCEGHHLVHWADGGPTNLANLALVCRAHHRAVHAGGWQLIRGPDGRCTATPPHRPHRRHPTAA
jgi:HNH endonuclease